MTVNDYFPCTLQDHNSSSKTSSHYCLWFAAVGLCMSSLQWEMRGQSVDSVCCSPQSSAESCIWQPYLENRKLFGLSSSLLLSFYALSSTISYDRLSWSQTYAL